MNKIIIYYKYIYIKDPNSLADWHREFCKSLNLTGRIIIAYEGINGTLGGSIEALEIYTDALNLNHLFSDIDFKESEGSSACFPRLSIKVKDEIVKLGVDSKVISAEDAGIHLTPHEVHELLTKKPDNLVILDTRNDYESRIGKFEGAILPEIQNFRDLPDYIDKNIQLFEDKDVLMYCTAGVRCERATAYLKSKNVAQKVYQIKGGIHCYVEKFPDGFFRGKNYVFDGRISLPVTSDILSNCHSCTQSCDKYTNCLNAECKKQIIICTNCLAQSHNTCSAQCFEKIQKGTVNIRKLSCNIQAETACYE